MIGNKGGRGGRVVRPQLGPHAFQGHANIDGDALGVNLVEFVEDAFEFERNALQARLATGLWGPGAITALADPGGQERPETA